MTLYACPREGCRGKLQMPRLQTGEHAVEWCPRCEHIVDIEGGVAKVVRWWE